MRIEKFLKNSGISVLAQLLTMLLAFVSRSVFVKFLPLELLGYQSLFSDVLSFLSMTDIGIGTAIVYNLYREIEHQDTEAVRKYVEIYKVYYRVIAILVTLLGLALIPVLPFVIKDSVSAGWNFLLKIYLLQLLGVVAGYFLSYRTTIYTADQKVYKCALWNAVGQLVTQCIQIIVLAWTKDYLLFLSVRVLIQILQNVGIYWMSCKDYPYLSTPCHLTKEDLHHANLLSDAKDYIVHKLSYFVYSSTDNFVISGLIGIRETALYGNYYTVENAVITLFLSKILSPLQVAVGNYVYSDQSEQRQAETFQMLNLLGFWIAAFVSTCFWILYQPFITLWLGEEYLLPFSFVIAVVLKLYLQLVSEVLYMYRAAYGEYDYDKKYMMFAAILNLSSSILLLKFWGITGVKVGTILGLAAIVFGRERFVFHRYPSFSERKFLQSQLCYLLVFIVDVWCCTRLAQFLPETFVGFLGKIIICMLVPNAIHLIFFFRSAEFKGLARYVWYFLKKFRKCKEQP